MFTDDEIIVCYSRADAIGDGVLVDVSETANEAGLKYPTAVTKAVWDRYVEFDPACVGQDIKGRLWDVLWMLRYEVKTRNPAGAMIPYSLYVAMPDKGDWLSNEDVPSRRDTGLSRRTHRLVHLKAICSPGDTADPVITIMLPTED